MNIQTTNEIQSICRLFMIFISIKAHKSDKIYVYHQWYKLPDGTVKHVPLVVQGGRMQVSYSSLPNIATCFGETPLQSEDKVKEDILC